MPWTVGGAFEQFRRDVVDLDPGHTKTARASRNYLFNEIERLARNNSDCPKLISDNPFISFGSFARKTKIKPLDDIDFLVILSGTYIPETIDFYNTHKLLLKPSFSFMGTRPPVTLAQLADRNGYINSTTVLNKIKFHLSSVPKYEKAEISRNREAVTLKLNSYTWNYDIVPAIPMFYNSGTLAYYSIPDGQGNWKPTNPRIDERNTTTVNTYHEGKFLPVIRLLKYWNGITSNKQKLPSYYFETLAIKVFDGSPKITNLQNGVRYFFNKFSYYLSQPCPDPKGLNPHLDANIDWSQKQKVISVIVKDSMCAENALSYESRSKHKEAIEQWQRIFGSRFPNYG
jgi:hypothetical protein